MILKLLRATALTLSIQSASASGVDCAFHDTMHDVDTYTNVPLAIRAMIGEMADRGGQWEATDSIGPGQRLPGRRLLRAGYRGDTWFVWWERGGIAHIWQAAVFRTDRPGHANVVGAMNIPIAWRNGGWTPTTDVCALIEGVMAGKYPPYPAGISGAALL